MSSTASTNMISKRYCPNCGSFILERIPRSFVQKVILKMQPKYSCYGCKEKISKAELNKNTAKEVPIFLEQTLNS